ncbi:MAG: tRNA uridine-5-carboxymethylaminomethyl(34) synthesis enzyme MnmG [Clostridiales Family XIII bacterium]|jgi:tRNA uridine 5-carboxymethylaminomethyl modification enzyme|nr:tRNA uridine-5-carboxymethylaminomethyl(34) synthesis enzyme MnmG [Clostridiales Family XIII bacterium]
MNHYDAIVVGAGHAGCEAALACARLGLETLILTMQMESVAMMPCNPSIGGTGKGQLVREIDALGGEMGVHIDKTFLQSRMLNGSKGPAVHSPRAQADKLRYHEEMIRVLKMQERLTLREGEVVDLRLKDGRVSGVLLDSGEIIASRTVILATGTYLSGLLHISDRAKQSGPAGLRASYALAENLRAKGLPLRRFKTGTPARALASTLDYGAMQEQHGDERIRPFSFLNEGKDIGGNRISCWLTWTNEVGHTLVAENIGRTAPYGGYTTGVGPRYCLSIEDKVSRFPERNRHQVFLEPESLSSDEVYIQGMSTSLPEDIQERFYRTIPGLTHAEFARYAYSIEYDCLDPLSLKPSLEYRHIAGLFCAGQFNGTSGYEEAAAQGLLAGINAARLLDGKPPWTPARSEAYIGVLIDDLVTKGTDEPYRIMTSRAEFRLILRQDNADLRLTETGHRLGLATEERYRLYRAHREQTEAELARLGRTFVSPAAADAFVGSLMDADQGRRPFRERVSLAGLLLRPEVSYASLSCIDIDRPEDLPDNVREQAEIQLKYRGYIEKQEIRVRRFQKMEGRQIPDGIDYAALHGLRNEARQKLAAQRPASIGQASRISGVSPADVNVLLIHLARMEGTR